MSANKYLRLRRKIMIQVKIKKLHPDAVIPKYATKGAACFDLVGLEYAEFFGPDGNPSKMHTGLAFEVPSGHVMLIYARSGMATEMGIRPSNCVGVIDSDYRGEVIVPLHSDRIGIQCIQKGTRIAQAMIVKLPEVELVEAEELSQTERGAGGFGSTGL